MSKVRRVYVEKKPDYAVKAKELHDEIKNYLNIDAEYVRVLVRYDVENLSDETYRKAINTVFSEPPVDMVYEGDELPMQDTDKVFSVEALPGQFDQRADSAEQCVKLLNEDEDPIIKTATTYILSGNVTDEQFKSVMEYCINPVDSRACGLEIPETLVTEYDEPADVIIFDGFKDMPEDKLKELYESLGLAMTFKDFLHIQNYFKNDEKRDPSMTEIRVLDTYWSDHCRHTTFSTELTDVTFDDGDYKELLEKTFDAYRAEMKEMYKDRDDKFVCLMDIALMGMKQLKAAGKLDDMEVSDEINACSIVVPVEVDGVTEEWLVFFKNETHNHPTEIEPFGGAATCLGGAIRDPLSGRGYVYQAMRVTGAADPTKSLKETLPNKLPQRKIVTTAAHGYSSYGNQIGLATGLVNEIYHPNYVAKRMEIGAVMGAAPRRAVKRLTSDPGDMIILLGGRTGRDGCGGATGSSKAHDSHSLESCGAEVQKGNPPTERKIQRLFRREEVSSLIKKCNDFGAGGVSVAIGELADGLTVDLDKVPKKYAGLDGTELAISESQERMAIVVDPADVDKMLGYAEEENLEAVVVAVVTEDPRLVLKWRGKEIVNIKRAFLDTNGAHQETTVKVNVPSKADNYFDEVKEPADVKKAWLDTLSDLNVCSQKGLVEMFDSSIGASTVTMPYGGKYQLTPTQTMIAKLPVLKGKTDTITMMSYGLDPYLSSWSPYHGSVYAVLTSVAKIAAAGGDVSKIRLTFQEYFKRLGTDPYRWGQPLAALLGAYDVQIGLGLPSIGGKDSMSGTFNDIDVPPTLCSFAVDVSSYKHVVTPELKAAGDVLVRLDVDKDENDIPVYADVLDKYDKLHKAITEDKIEAAYVIGFGGLIEAVSKMAFGNKFGVAIDDGVTKRKLVSKDYGSIILEVKPENVDKLGVTVKKIGTVNDSAAFTYGDVTVTVEEAIKAWTTKLEKVFPTKSKVPQTEINTGLFDAKTVYTSKNKVAKPKVFIPVFPGTNCEYDSAKAFERAGAEVQTVVFRNMTAQGIRDSVDAFAKAISDSQIIMFPGGFSAGDEPDGSGKFIATAFRNAKISEEVMKLLNERDGLALGICNGFQALIKLGLVPYGEIRPQSETSPTLTMNSIGRHQSKIAYTKVVTNKSPWLAQAELGGVYSIPISHGEGRFVASKEWCEKLFANGQVATQYVDLNGNPTMDEYYNVNGSYYAIEGITSPDGRVLGKMGHSERIGEAVAVNIYGNQDQKIFESGVAYFK
ncbi:MAG: phosphoribosylformylglycinamidine synthase [Coprococcus sp.]|jgi:phosphoribosylformylglycinamidine synthase|uniref:phosphoribosylformylglycinamidine synthase n=1 Tax=Coprococcus sp. OM04-5BH TaxID=2293093 RepID=UPI000E516271|nr:phosphoribosylformylglycinamidine synthase [Coprococcus sp. OM04-5BH]MEE0035294.1 phosphoribosylformylglycinamidine synthase [Coprococcus sp.]RHV31958.1 phosphoribosylformylglycinamidine synthase [Coprococcus sp. OM04-5BH]